MNVVGFSCRRMDLAAAIFAFTLVLGPFGNALAADPFKVGVVAPTTGAVATVGLRQLRTFEWWEQEINAKGGIKGRPVKVMHCNDEGRPERAVACGRDLLGSGVSVLVGATLSGAIRAMVPLVKNGPALLTASPNVEPDASGYVFQTSPTDRDMTEALALYLKSNGVSTLGMIAATDASGEVAVANARSVFPAAGIDVKIVRIDLRANDAGTQLASIANSDVPAIYSAYSGGGQAIVVKSFMNLGLKQPLIVSNANVSAAFVNLISNEMPKRMLSIAPRGVDPQLLANDAERKRVDEFTKSYVAWAKEEPDQLNLLALGLADTTFAILSNVDNLADPAAVKKFLQATAIASYQTIKFTPKSNIGMVANDIAIVELKNKVWKKADRLQAQ